MFASGTCQLLGDKFVDCCGRLPGEIVVGVQKAGVCLTMSCVRADAVLLSQPNTLNTSGTWTSPYVMFAQKAAVFVGGFDGVSAETTLEA